MFEPGSCLFRWQLTLLFSLFFLWGAANNLNDVLIRQFTKAFALSNVIASLVQTYANTYVPESQCYIRVPEAQSSLLPRHWAWYGASVLHALHVRRTLTSLGRAVRTAYRGTAGADVLFLRLLLRRATRRLDRAAARLPRRRHPGARPLLDRCSV